MPDTMKHAAAIRTYYSTLKEILVERDCAQQHATLLQHAADFAQALLNLFPRQMLDNLRAENDVKELVRKRNRFDMSDSPIDPSGREPRNRCLNRIQRVRVPTIRAAFLLEPTITDTDIQHSDPLAAGNLFRLVEQEIQSGNRQGKLLQPFSLKVVPNFVLTHINRFQLKIGSNARGRAPVIRSSVQHPARTLPVTVF